MQVDNEQRGRRKETRLGAQEPAIGPPVVYTRALVQLLGITPQVPAVRSQSTRVLRRTTDVEQRIPVAARMTVFPFRKDGECRDAYCSEPFSVMDSRMSERLTLAGRLCIHVSRAVVPTCIQILRRQPRSNSAQQQHADNRRAHHRYV